MNDQLRQGLLQHTHNLVTALSGLSPSAPDHVPTWSNEDAERLASMAATGEVQLISAGESARHGLDNIWRIATSVHSGTRHPAQETIESYRQYYMYAMMALLRLEQLLSENTAVAAVEDDVLRKFLAWVSTFPLFRELITQDDNSQRRRGL